MIVQVNLQKIPTSIDEFTQEQQYLYIYIDSQENEVKENFKLISIDTDNLTAELEILD